jgi:hypothetical protein
MEAADPADVSNAVEAAGAVADAVENSAASDRDVWRESRGNDRRRDGNSNGRCSQHGSVPP